MPVVRAEFDGRVFVPCDPVDVPAGTKVEVMVPPAPATPEEQARWEEIKRQIDASEPHWPTLDEAMRYIRKRP
jgi:hypothetical protein